MIILKWFNSQYLTLNSTISNSGNDSTTNWYSSSISIVEKEGGKNQFLKLPTWTCHYQWYDDLELQTQIAAFSLTLNE